MKVFPKDARELDALRKYQHMSAGHPNLIQIFHAGEEPDFFYYAMELADGADHGETNEPHADSAGAPPSTLKDLMEAEGRVEPARALWMIADVVRGLGHLHSEGLLHRDVKPTNVLFVNGTLKLADIGLVTGLQSQITMLGTPGYMPPDLKVDESADLYAAGMMLYEMITGMEPAEFPELPPFKPRSRAERCDYRTAIHVVNKAATPQKKDRYRSAAEFLDDVTARRQRDPAKIRRGVLLTLVPVVLALAVWAGWPASPQLMRIDVKDANNGDLELVYSRGPSEQASLNMEIPGALVYRPVLGGEPIAVAGTGMNGEYPQSLLVIDPAEPDWISATPWKMDALLTSDWPSSSVNRVKPLVGGDLDGRDGEELVVGVLDKAGPTYCTVFSGDPRATLTPLSEFWHYGNLHYAVAIDLNDDGSTEVVYAGVANMGPDGGDAHIVVLATDPRDQTPNRCWSMNAGMIDWTNPPLAYGQVTLNLDELNRDTDKKIEGYRLRRSDDGVGVLHLDFYGVRVALKSDLSVEKFRPIGTSGHSEKALEEREKIWCRLWPKSEDCATRSAADGE